MRPEHEFELFVQRSSTPLLRLALLLVTERSLAEDVVQTALLNVFRRWNSIESRDAVHAYARQAVIRTALNWRVRYRQRNLYVIREQSGGGSSADAVEASVDRLWLWPLVCALPPRQRAVLVLRYYADMTEADTANALGVSIGTVKSHHARAIAHLRRKTGMQDMPDNGRLNTEIDHA